MDSQQAREVLHRYRPGTSDETDPEIRAALEWASLDPELAAWLNDHIQWQRQIHQTLAGLDVPPGLREQILSERKARVGSRNATRAWGAAAVAVVVLVLGLLIWLPLRIDPESQFSTFRSRMVKTALRGYAMDLDTRNEEEIRAYLDARRLGSDWSSPAGLESMPLMGCAIITWRNQPSAMICYGTNRSPDLWLFVAKSSVFPDPPSELNPVLEKVNRLNTIGWTVDGITYVLAGELAEEELVRLSGQRL